MWDWIYTSIVNTPVFPFSTIITIFILLNLLEEWLVLLLKEIESSWI